MSPRIILVAIAWVVIAILAVIGIAILALPSEGHGLAQWIADGGYVGNDGVKCCGPTDCEMKPESAFTRTSDGGWAIDGQVFHHGDKGFYENPHDGHIWICHHLESPHLYRCLFVPEEGT